MRVVIVNVLSVKMDQEKCCKPEKKTQTKLTAGFFGSCEFAQLQVLVN
jgi:hypothetical protein